MNTLLRVLWHMIRGHDVRRAGNTGRWICLAGWCDEVYLNGERP